MSSGHGHRASDSNRSAVYRLNVLCLLLTAYRSLITDVLTPLRLLLLIAHAGVLGIAALNVAYLRLTRTPRLLRAPAPRVSVLVPARNEAATLPRLLRSLLNQEYADFEVIVVDDASEDDTWGTLDRHAHPRLRAIRSPGPPAGWVGKNHALHTAADAASGDVLLFLDADTNLADPTALRRLVEAHAALSPDAVLTGLPRFLDRGPALWLTGLVPFALMTGLPMPLARHVRSPLLSALNGQVWMAPADVYRRLQPHSAVRADVLEDIEIGRLLKRAGVPLALRDLTGEVEVEMYRTLAEAWRGFRKNAYLLQGGRPAPFLAFLALYTAIFVVAPRLDRRMLLSTLAAKALADRAGRLPLASLPFAPFSLFLGAVLQLDSARAHWTGRVQWKGRDVSRAAITPASA